jgi:hypothetical protein
MILRSPTVYRRRRTMMHGLISNVTPLEVSGDVRAVDRIKRDATLVEVSQELTGGTDVCANRVP